MHPELERRMLAAHQLDLQRLASAPRHRMPDGSRAPRNRPRVRAGMALMRLGARLARPAIEVRAPWQPEVLTGRG